jgi:hypothetical protein
MLRAEGLGIVPSSCAGLAAGARIEVELLPRAI